jgi:hypothetical protein
MEQWLEDWKPSQHRVAHLELLTWAEIHERTRAYYGHYRAVLEGDIDDPCFDRKQRELARTRDVLTDLQRGGRKDLPTGGGQPPLRRPSTPDGSDPASN